MNLLNVLDILANNLVPVSLVAASGYAISKTLNPDVKAISRVAFYIFSPCLVFTAITRSQLASDEFGRMAVFTFGAVLGSGVLALAASRLLGYSRRVTAAVLLSVMFVNGGNLGLPLNGYAFGEAGLARAVLYFVFSAVLVYTVGVFVASRGSLSARQALVSVLKVPALYALPLAGLVQITGWKLPLALQRPIELLGDAAIPSMLVILGMQLARTQWRGRISRPQQGGRGLVQSDPCPQSFGRVYAERSRSTQDKTGAWEPLQLIHRGALRIGPVGVVMGLRLLAGPLIGLLMAALSGITGPGRQAAVLESAMPTAVVTTILAVEYDVHPEFVSSAVLTTTLLSSLTLAPLIAYLQL